MSDSAFPSALSAVQSVEQPVAQPANGLRPRLGGRFGRIDPEAIARAEAALKSLSSQFAQWLEDEVAKLEAARAAIAERGATQDTLNQLYTHAHDLKGLGSTYEFPIITHIAGSLCQVLGEGDERLRAPLPLIDAHIDAIRTSVRDNLKTIEDPMGSALTQALSAKVDASRRTL